jgi:hypothetical protein
MSKEELTATKQLIRQEVLEGLKDYVFPVILDMANAQEASAVSVKQQVKNMVEALEPRPKTDGMADTEEIHWTAQTGTKGPYERSDDKDNPRHQALLKTLQTHQGAMRSGNYFLWIFDDHQTIGRKLLA